MQVNELAKQSGVSGHTIRYYTRCGLLKPVKDNNRYHRYSQKDLARLGFIRCLREFHLSLDKIKQLLGLAENGGIPLEVIYDCLQQEFRREKNEVEEKLEVMQRLSKVMANWNNLDGLQSISLQGLEALFNRLESN